MTDAVDLSLWVALPVAVLVLVGAALALIGSLGLLQLRRFYDRIHAPTLGTTLGIGSILIGSMLYFSATQTRVVVHEVVIAVFMIMTTPVTLILLARAALYRDQRENSSEVPSRPQPASPEERPSE